MVHVLFSVVYLLQMSSSLADMLLELGHGVTKR